MNRKAWTVSVLGMTFGLALVAVNATAAPEEVSNETKIAAFTQELKTLTPAKLADLKPLEVHRFQLPGSGIDVMRARLQETYSVDGVGTDTVELTGWIAVKHDNARPVNGTLELSWNTAVVDTEFIAMDVSGTSEVFGPVSVSIDRSRPSRGQVGQVAIPEKAMATLLARRAAEGQIASAKGAEATATAEPDASVVCSAPVYASVTMPDLGLKMNTKTEVFWYSLVDTIPPVGSTASVAIEPVRLVTDDGREVATLESGIVKFREVVRHVALSDGAERLAKGNK